MNRPAGKVHEEETAEIWRPGRLWSLWDMLELHANAFLGAVAQMAAVRAIIGTFSDKSELLNAESKNNTLANVDHLMSELGKVDARSALKKCISAKRDAVQRE